MKMTYFRMRMDIRKILEIEISQDHETYQHKVTTILAEHFAPKLKLFKSCATLGNRYNIEPRELYLAAINAKISDELSGLLPQITHNLSVEDAFDKLLLHDSPVAWASVDDTGRPKRIYLTEPGDKINSVKLPIKIQFGEVGMNIQPIKTAPKDGRWIKLHRKRGDAHNGRWGTKKSLFRFGHQWISDSGKFLDVFINKVVGWTEIQRIK